jgi:uncharacterized membrane protein
VQASVISGPLVRYGFFPFWKTVPVLTEELNTFLMLLVLLFVFMSVVALFKVLKKQQVEIWGTIAAFAPVGLFAVAALKIESYGYQFAWLSVAFVLALYSFMIAVFLHKRLEIEESSADEKVMGLMATGVIAALSVGLTFSLEKAALTVALAFMLPVLAWIYSRYTYRVFRWVALFFAIMIIGRILIDPWLLSLPMEGWNRLPWIWGAYGLPLVFFVIASRYFKLDEADLTIHVLDLGRLVFASLTVGFSIRVIAGAESLGSEQFGYLELALTTTAWFGFTLSLRRLNRQNFSLIFDGGWKLFGVLASLQLVGLLIFYNPVFTKIPVGDWPLFNALSFAYLAPAVLLGLLFLDFNLYGPRDLRKAVLIASFVSGVTYIGLSIRHLFHGSIMDGRVYQSESLTYSAVGLAIGVVLFLYAHAKQNESIRKPALAILVMVSAKVFVLDLAGLDGLLRAASFMGLGASLIGLGWLYQKGQTRVVLDEEKGA